MSKTLVLTLGHNASAICIIDGLIACGYEEERFTLRKSDSSFPINSIRRICEYYGDKFNNICIGHWFTGGQLVDCKYVDHNFLQSLLVPGGQIYSIDPTSNFTHHDSHMLSAKSFNDYYDMPKERLAIVADGFGTFGECISVYEGQSITARYFGYGKSLGLLYQYATAYLEMKMHNHEYKMLGYEAHIRDVTTVKEFETLNAIVQDGAARRIKSLLAGTIEKDTDPVVSTGALAAAQHEITNELDEVASNFEFITLAKKRIIIAYYVQGIVEAVMSAIVDRYKPKYLTVSGGLFYNVKLNHLLADKVERFSVMPLAGDQGAGLGVYQRYLGDYAWPGHLNWGKRNLSKVQEGDGIVIVSDLDSAIDAMSHFISKYGFANLVKGEMEFGPRSLCNSATIAKPEIGFVNQINDMNDRTSVMPMAPAMTFEQAHRILNGCDKVVGSLEYMVVTRDVNIGQSDKIAGAAHYYEHLSKSTCRPQIVGENDLVMHSLLEQFGPLINTSFNYHGVPIVFDAESIENSHKKQSEVAPIKTVVLI